MRRRIARYALNTLTALSLLLCVASVGLWVRSYFGGDYFHWLRDTPGTSLWIRRIYLAYSSHGGVRLDESYSLSTDPHEMWTFRDDAKTEPRFRHETCHFPGYPEIDLVPANQFGWSHRIGFTTTAAMTL